MKKNKIPAHQRKKVKEEAKLKLALKLLNMEATLQKYPKGSYIHFFGERKNENEQPLVSCGYYNKMYFPKKNEYLKHNESGPPEWQNLSVEEAEKIGSQFDRCSIWILGYVSTPQGKGFK